MLGTVHGEFLFSPRFMPDEASAKSVFGIADAVDKLGNGGLQTRSTLEIERSDFHIAGTLRHSEKVFGRGRHDDAVMLGNDVVEHRKVGTVVKGQTFLTVVNVKIIRHNVFTRNDAVAEALYGDVAYDVVVVLIARQDQPRRVTGVRLKLLPEKGISHLLTDAEL